MPRRVVVAATGSFAPALRLPALIARVVSEAATLVALDRASPSSEQTARFENHLRVVFCVAEAVEAVRKFVQHVPAQNVPRAVCVYAKSMFLDEDRMN